MDFEKLMEKDLEYCQDMGGVCQHYYKDTVETLEYLYFEKNTEVIFDSQSEFSEVEANVPSIVFATHKTNHIKHSSTFTIKDIAYHVVHIDHKNDSTTRVYLGR
jgi:hypothetical protein